MSGDSPNAFTNENVFDFRDGRSSPAPTTSKEHERSGGVVTASVLVEPQKSEINKDEKEDDPDFSSPTLNPGADKNHKKQHSDVEKTQEMSNDPKKNDDDNKKEEQNLLNGGPDRLPKACERRKQFDEEESEDDTCIVNCLYYTMECCKCSIV